MKKYLLLLLAFTPILTFFSCSSSDEGTETQLSKSEIIGTWVGTDKVLRKDTLVFLNNNRCSLVSHHMKETGSGAFKNLSIKLNGTYKLDNEKITITWTDKQEYVYTFAKTGWVDMSIEHPTATFVFTKYHPNGGGMVYTGESAYHGYSQSYFDKLK